MDIKGERERLGETGAEIDTCKLLEVTMLSLRLVVYFVTVICYAVLLIQC